MTEPATVDPKVLYIVGKGRSGTTLLDELLGQLGGFFSTGELHRLWSWHLAAGYPCSCGAPVRTCPVWSRVLEELRRLAGAVRVDVAAGMTQRALSWTRAPAVFVGRSATWSLRPYAGLMSHLYAAIVAVTGARVVVDSSKWPAHPGALGLVPAIQPCVVQLVRDPRGVAFSYRRNKRTQGRQPDMPRYSSLHTALSWTARNLIAEAVLRRSPGPSHRLRYEELATDPRTTIESIAELVGEPTEAEFIHDSTATIRGNHVLGGNPDRFERGRIEIREDGTWRRAMTPRDEATVSLVAAPLLRRYGYPRRVRP